MDFHKVAFFLNTLLIGGTERVVSELTFGFPCNIDKYLIITSNQVENRFQAKLRVLNTWQTNFFLFRILKNLLIFFRLRSLKKAENFTHVLSFLEAPNILNLLTRRNEKIIISVRIYLTDHINSQGIEGKAVSLFIKYLYGKADKIVVNSRLIKRDLISNFGICHKRIITIYNPVNYCLFENLSSESVETDIQKVFQSPTLIIVGRLIPRKQHHLLIKIFPHIQKVVPNIKLMIIGDGESRQFLIKLSQKLNLKVHRNGEQNDAIENDIYFLGNQKNPFKYLSRATLFVFPTILEGFPNVLTEAMACKLPVVSADCKSGPREILAPNTPPDQLTEVPDYAEFGVLLPIKKSSLNNCLNNLTENELIWKNAIINMIENEELRDHYKKQSFKRVRDFDIEKIIQQWVDLFG